MKLLLGITGASGSPYALRAIRAMLECGIRPAICCTEAGEAVFTHETGKSIADLALEHNLPLYDNRDLFAPVASGSYPLDAMLVLPCSMSTLGEIAHGCGKGLLARAADVCLKESRRLVLAVRETPLHLIHIENMASAARAGAVIMPCTPGFYHPMQSVEDIVDFIAGRALHTAGVPNALYKQWKGDQ